jgi:hypothetical protein
MPKPSHDDVYLLAAFKSGIKKKKKKKNTKTTHGTI